MAHSTHAHCDTIRSVTRRKPQAAGLLRRLFGTWQQRQHLDRLDPHLLRDIGLTEDDVRREIKRPVWDNPSHWQR